MCFPNKEITSKSGHTNHDVLYVAFRGKRAVPGDDVADWGALNATTFERSLEGFGDRLVARINVGRQDMSSSEPVERDDGTDEGDEGDEGDGNGEEQQEETNKVGKQVHGDVQGNNGCRCDVVDQENEQDEEDENSDSQEEEDSESEDDEEFGFESGESSQPEDDGDSDS